MLDLERLFDGDEYLVDLARDVLQYVRSYGNVPLDEIKDNIADKRATNGDPRSGEVYDLVDVIIIENLVNVGKLNDDHGNISLGSQKDNYDDDFNHVE